ncbi:hypothetical protein POVWA1_080600 [Plasmodium ovale wallikeri]|uniref:PIR Superfamily Protein n=1 Tax=Plasmodium ovale wallikeri TaxID=864142 RepID=A0A1A9ALW7_PLAOA|nr:hypothetical protein POVWA1_080600 [Plasmodium ovale wallikeri]
MHLEHINSSNSYVDTPVRCEYLNYSLHHNVAKINEITDHIKMFYNKLIRAYNSCSQNLNVCDRNGVHIEREGLEKLKELYNIYDYYFMFNIYYQPYNSSNCQKEQLCVDIHLKYVDKCSKIIGNNYC